MKSTVRLWLAGAAVAGALILSACGGGGGGGAASANVNIGSAGENLAFDQTTVTVPAGQQITVTFKNNSTAQQHNWVLVKGGDDVASTVDEEAVNVGPPDYIPADAANIVANSKMLQPGASETVTFTAPAAGTYTFLCTYPAHYAGGMKGTLTVQ